MNIVIKEPEPCPDCGKDWGRSWCGTCGGSGTNAATGIYMNVEAVRDAILEAHKQSGDDNCWLDIDKIFLAAGLSVPDRKVGDKTAMLKNCARYIDTMCQGGDWPTYQELKDMLLRLDSFNFDPKLCKDYRELLKRLRGCNETQTTD